MVRVPPIDEAIRYAQTLIKRLCCYGGGRFCDCKFVDLEKRAKKGIILPGGEDTGCCEARSLLAFLENLKEQQEPPAPTFDYNKLWSAYDKT